MAMLAGGVPAASAVTPTDIAAAPAGAAFDLAIPAAKLTNVNLTIRKSTGYWYELTVNWGISYTEADIAAQTTYKTWVYIFEQDDSFDDTIASSESKAAFLKPRAQPHSITQTIFATSGAIGTEMGDEEIYAQAIFQNRTTGLYFKLNTRRVVIDD
ncbi:hypothetical protein ABZZ36_43090 [Actinacidiphila glaucinigra]|uniref:hypothetical protein n=1 Tax=Actinacidiphila glaucinigra TaxID=235986 RepID=UPI0033A6A5EC